MRFGGNVESWGGREEESKSESTGRVVFGGRIPESGGRRQQGVEQESITTFGFGHPVLALYNISIKLSKDFNMSSSFAQASVLCSYNP